MNDKDDRANSHFNLVESHESMLPLLDAYVTDELEHDQHEKIKYHLESCHECQQKLAEITQFRKLLATLAANASQLEMSEDTGQIRHIRRSSQLADVILAEIDRNKGKEQICNKRILSRRIEINYPMRCPTKEEGGPYTAALLPPHPAVSCLLAL